ncbi:MAG: FAD-dependent oxidoreductase [Cyclobacteriaceae bacterium]
MLSYWEKTSFQHYDIAVIGGGITGLSTAISIKENMREANVVVIERGILPTGASTKNAGFACFGSPSELLSDIGNFGEDEALNLVTKRWTGLKKLRERLGDTRIGLEIKGGYELLGKKELKTLEGIDYLNDWLWPLFESNVFEAKTGFVSQANLNPNSFEAAIYNPFEGQLDTGKLMKALQNYAQMLGITLLTGTEVLDLMEDDHEVALRLKSDECKVEILANQVAICTNAFSKKFVDNIDMQPGRGTVIVTEPIEDLKLSGTFHYDEGYYYFRDVDGRMLLGGGRNQDFETEQTTEIEINKMIEAHLKEFLFEKILQKEVKIEMAWSGIMAFGPSKSPVIKRTSPGVVIGARLGGMGLALGTLVGEEVAALLLNK